VGDFEWPPAIPTETFWPGGQGGGHGTPGKLTLVAETLIRRAKHLLASVESGPDAVRGAVLSTDALESTGCRTPTTATEALALKHSFEVLAECQFSGVEYHISIRPRLNEVRAETAVISRWFAKEQSANAMLNAEMYVLQRVVRILRQHAQFDEEQLCMNRVRSLHNTLWMRQSASRLVLFPLLRYLELLLSSFAVFVGVLVVWVTGLALLFGWSNAYPAPYETYTGIYAGVADAVSSFFSNGPTITHKLTPKDTSNLPWRHVGVACLAMVSGFLHLGVFMAHMYTIASRK
jgi:hypothetical protein